MWVITLYLYLFFSVYQLEEYRGKALYIERFSYFIEWPVKNENEFSICILGHNPFNSVINEELGTHKILNKPVRIRTISHLSELHQADILFIAQNKSEELESILQQLKTQPVLTISDSEGFGEKGVHINFFMDEGKLRFEINLKSLRASPLNVSYQLLELAHIIE